MGLFQENREKTINDGSRADRSVIVPCNDMENTRAQLSGFLVFTFIRSASESFPQPPVWNWRWDNMQQGTERQVGRKLQRKVPPLSFL